MYPLSNLAKSAEAMFSRWAIRRLCKFLLKKKLGQFILGDIDIDQLDVQLWSGFIQLSDLALNVDCLNQKLGAAAALVVKEGSIGSLTVQMPWRGNGCQIEIDELELVLAPCGGTSPPSGIETCIPSEDGNYRVSHDCRKPEHGTMEKSGVSSSNADVHEGVKTIAKMVKWVLTSLNIKLKKLIVAFDPHPEIDEIGAGSRKTLVLRITEIECGTRFCDDAEPKREAGVDNFLGISQLTNFVKFHGAILEILEMDDVERQTRSTFTGCTPSHSTTPILTGESGGFSGTINLSIPWKNGTLDIRKVDANVYIDPLLLKCQPSTVKWFACLFASLKNVDKDDKGHVHLKTTDSVYFNSASQWSSSSLGSTTTACDKVTANHDSLFADFSSPKGQEMGSDTLLPGSHLISDWVPFFTNKNLEDGSEEPDFGASMDQFFECFDEMRSSQSALGNSGVWNWTCSVFNAITAASNLASGSFHVSSEQKHVETNLKATVSGISVVFSFHEEDKKHSHDHIKDGSNDHYLVAECQEILLVLEVCPREMKFETSVKHIEIADYFINADIPSQTLFIQHLQAEVQSVLPPIDSLPEHPNVGRPRGFKKDGMDKVLLLQTSGPTHFLYTVNSGSSRGSTRLTSFSMNLPPLVFWVDFHLIHMVLDLLNEVENSFASEGLLSHGDLKSSPNGSLRGNIFLPNARILLCFPFEKRGVSGNFFHWDQFIVLDFSEKVSCFNPVHEANSQKRYSSTMARSLDLNMGSLDIYLITSASEDSLQKQKLSSKNILSITNERGSLSFISMLWPDSPSTGPWITRKAKHLATFENSRSNNKVMGRGYELSSVTTVKDTEDLDSLTRQEIISSSESLLHARLSPVTVNLARSQYESLHRLLNQLIDGLSCGSHDSPKGESRVSQTSILVECDSVEITINPNKVEEKKSSIQSELPGWWHRLKLKIQKFELSSVSNIGGVMGNNFIWVVHGEGKLWGSITGSLDQEILLISCSNSAMRRGDGEGSNILSSKFAGSRIVYLCDTQNFQKFTSITIRCCTLVAAGGRLDWLVPLSSFFNLPSSEVEQDSEECGLHKVSFILNFVDIGLSYEPYLKNAVTGGDDIESELGYTDVKKETTDKFVACLIAASSLNLSSTTGGDSSGDDYKIRVHDLGLLLCPVTGAETVSGIYSVPHLHKIGYAKVAGEALIEAGLRTNCKNGLLWELECSDCHIILDTCNDTTSGLICLAGQIQKLFAPDVEESVVHLQTRWNNVQRAQESYDSDESRVLGSDSVPSTSHVHTSPVCPRSKSKVPGLMDEICEDAFHLDGNRIRQTDSEFQDLSSSNESSCENLNSRSGNLENRNTGTKDTGRGSNGWYGEASLELVENHLSELIEKTGMKQLVGGNFSPLNSTRGDGSGDPAGRVLLKNINIRWRIYAGSDWNDLGKHFQYSGDARGRDTTVSIELSLSGIDFKYDIFPEGVVCVSKLSLSVQDFHLYDNSVDAPWKMILGYYHSKDHPRESSSKAFKLKLESVRPDPLTPLEEYRLRVAFLPMLLHLHQGQLDFLINFFGGRNSSADVPSSHDSDGSQTKNEHNVAEEALLPYFQKFDIWPVLVRVDYSPCRVDLAALREGKYVELVNLVPWKGVELQLKHVHAVGVYGWGSVCETVVGDWLEDISQNQVHKLLQGLPTIRSLFAVGSGAAKLVSLPVKNYRKDRKLVKGMQRGTIAFLRSISVEAVGLGVHLAAGAHDILLQAEYILTSIPPSVPLHGRSRTKTNVRSNQPKDAQQGIQQAYESLSDGLGKSASALVRAPLKSYQRGAGAGSALATAVRGAPVAAIAPFSATVRAVHCALLGVRNSLDPDHKKESAEKYLGPRQPREHS